MGYGGGGGSAFLKLLCGISKSLRAFEYNEPSI